MHKDETIKPQSLSIIAIIRHALVSTWENRSQIFKALKYPGLGVVIISFWQHPSITKEADILSWLLFACEMYFITLFSVRAHRLVLLSESPGNIKGALQWSKRETRFLLFSVGLGVICAALYITQIFLIAPFFFKLSTILKIDDRFVVYAFSLPSGYVFSRLSLGLPSIAIGNTDSLISVWQISAGNGWRLFLLISLLPIISSTILYVIGDVSIMMNVALAITGLVFFLVGLRILSQAFKELTTGNYERS